VKEKALSCAGLRDLRLTFTPAWLRNSVAACGLARSMAAYDGGFGIRSWYLVPLPSGTQFRLLLELTAVDRTGTEM